MGMHDGVRALCIESVFVATTFNRTKHNNINARNIQTKWLYSHTLISTDNSHLMSAPNFSDVCFFFEHINHIFIYVLIFVHDALWYNPNTHTHSHNNYAVICALIHTPTCTSAPIEMPNFDPAHCECSLLSPSSVYMCVCVCRHRLIALIRLQKLVAEVPIAPAMMRRWIFKGVHIIYYQVAACI